MDEFVKLRRQLDKIMLVVFTGVSMWCGGAFLVFFIEGRPILGSAALAFGLFLLGALVKMAAEHFGRALPWLCALFIGWTVALAGLGLLLLAVALVLSGGIVTGLGAKELRRFFKGGGIELL